MNQKYVERIKLAAERDRKVGFADIKIGDIQVRGIAIWRAGNGKLTVFFPSKMTDNRTWEDIVVVPAELRSEIEAEIIAAYQEKQPETGRLTRFGKPYLATLK